MASIAGPYMPARSAPAESAPLLDLMRAGAIGAFVQSAWLALALVATLGFARPLNFFATLGDPAPEIAALHSGAALLIPVSMLLLVGSPTFVVATLAVAEYLRRGAPGLVAVASAFGYLGGAALIFDQGITYTLVSQSQRAADSVLAQELAAVAVGTSAALGLGLYSLGLWIGLVSLAVLIVARSTKPPVQLWSTSARRAVHNQGVLGQSASRPLRSCTNHPFCAFPHSTGFVPFAAFTQMAIFTVDVPGPRHRAAGPEQQPLSLLSPGWRASTLDRQLVSLANRSLGR